MAKDRLYYDEPMLWEFEAKVLSCAGPSIDQAGKQAWKVRLLPNAFYPESGGQPSDRGKIADADVIDVMEEADGSVSVVINAPVHEGTVKCLVDGVRRFDFMQQHTGQHILSSAFEQLFGFETVGFHLGDVNCTVDLEAEKLEEWQADKAEAMSNDVVFRNVPVLARFVDTEQLSEMNLRKPPKVDSDIRIVSVEGFDNCPCGGTHVRSTGEIGLIKITRVDRAKGRVRLELLCGMRALADYRDKNRQLLKAAALLSVHPQDLESQIDRLTGQVKDLRRTLQDTELRLMEYDAAAVWASTESYKGVKIVAHNAGAGGMDLAKQFALRLANNPSTVAVVGTTGTDNAYIVVARSTGLQVDASVAFKAGVGLLEGRGGGNAGLAQGGGSRTESLPSAIVAAKENLIAQVDGLGANS